MNRLFLNKKQINKKLIFGLSGFTLTASILCESNSNLPTKHKKNFPNNIELANYYKHFISKNKNLTILHYNEDDIYQLNHEDLMALNNYKKQNSALKLDLTNFSTFKLSEKLNSTEIKQKLSSITNNIFNNLKSWGSKESLNSLLPIEVANITENIKNKGQEVIEKIKTEEFQNNSRDIALESIEKTINLYHKIDSIIKEKYSLIKTDKFYLDIKQKLNKNKEIAIKIASFYLKDLEITLNKYSKLGLENYQFLKVEADQYYRKANNIAFQYSKLANDYKESINIKRLEALNSSKVILETWKKENPELTKKLEDYLEYKNKFLSTLNKFRNELDNETIEARLYFCGVGL